ncbi:S-adenosylmethionine:tRNA ribosyltransferase-isomerase [Pseudocnuella soli]|uniref:S-adenosylmethionine:tRNA ribosyltransferase-isomerase n=1 Tax=Pseudocnuella soli TaxID=2502779 RepID=UPI001042B2F5|nr:S-adenosylmethionine:tRNA ribosyltransferase-isomerase [Pseudocnuella soli]
MKPEAIKIDAYTYDLPDDRIAAFPLSKRDDSKLLVYESGKIEDDHFYNLPQHLPQGATLVVNNTRVIEARLLFQKPTGGVIEIFCLEPTDLPMESALAQSGTVRWNCMVGGASKWKPGQVLRKELAGGAELRAYYIDKQPQHFIIGFEWHPAHLAFAEILHEAGAIPLPPYIKRAAQTDDATRYQTIFSQEQGSVAAPTASLHFTPEVFGALAQKGIHTAPLTLHVGAGTFKPVKSETIGEHQMHAEHFHVSKTTLEQLIAAEQIVASGTTSLRTLESLYWIGVKLLRQQFDGAGELWLDQWECYILMDETTSYAQSLAALVQHLDRISESVLYCKTSLLIVPGYRFRSAMALITNFHQPQSTLLLLVAAFIGADWRKVYDHAMERDYRFLSYGDSSLLYRKEPENAPLG